LATTDFQITEANIGEMIGPQDGFLVALSRTRPHVHDGAPRWSASRLRWLSGYFVLKGTRDARNLISIDPSNGHAFIDYGGYGWPVAHVAMSASLDYAGLLEIVCVPKGSEWAITLSDVPVARQLPPSATNFVASNYKPTNPPHP
jgi:hypothetical protein